jgi:flavin reductase (DIM6/NTAB) family NADH-FMN oxidoreductase RutF
MTVNAEPGLSIPETVRRIHRTYPSGLTIVTTMHEGRPQGLAVSAFSSVSLDPPTVMVCVQMTSSNHARFYAAERLGINIVSVDQASEARRFATASGDKFAGIPWAPGVHGVPILDHAAGYFEVAIQERVLAHTHTIFFGRVLEAGVREWTRPLVYVNGGFYDGKGLAGLEEQAR